MNDLEDPVTREKIILDYPRMELDGKFVFACHPGLSCFTFCCKDVSIVLTPYDVLRLTRALKMDSSEFLEKYTITGVAREPNFPVVLLKMGEEDKRCLLLGEAGCSIYRDRPWACRMYPLGAAEPQNPNPTDHAFHFLIREDLCKGHGEGREWTVREWIADQGIEEYDMMGSSFKELMLHPGWTGKEPVPAGKLDMVYMACYDLDRFRRFIFETKFLAYFEVDEARVEAIRTDSEELLEFAIQWLRFSLFGDRTMKIRKSVAEAVKKTAAAQQAVEAQQATEAAKKDDGAKP
jgi:Fe-S-cluster containining protein